MSTVITSPASSCDAARLLPARSASIPANSRRRSISSSSSLSSTRDRAIAVRGSTLFRRGPVVCESVRLDVLDAVLSGVGISRADKVELVEERGARSVSSIAMPSGFRIFLSHQLRITRSARCYALGQIRLLVVDALPRSSHPSALIIRQARQESRLARGYRIQRCLIRHAGYS